MFDEEFHCGAAGFGEEFWKVVQKVRSVLRFLRSFSEGCDKFCADI